MIRMAGLSAEALTQAADEVAAAVPTGQTAVRAMPTDVSNPQYYHKVVEVTLTLSVSTLVLNMVIGLAVALLLNERIRGRGAFRTIWYLPVVISDPQETD